MTSTQKSSQRASDGAVSLKDQSLLRSLELWTLSLKPPGRAEFELEIELINHTSIVNGKGNGNPLQYSSLENPMNRGAWWAAVHGVTKSWTWLSDWPCVVKRLWKPLNDGVTVGEHDATLERFPTQIRQGTLRPFPCLVLCALSFGLFLTCILYN